MKPKLSFIAAMLTALTVTGLQSANAQNIFPDSGKVGIGTKTPGVQLDVNATASGQLARFNGSSSLMFMGLYEGGVYRGYIGSYAGNNEDVDFGTGGGTTGKVHLTIKASPKLTIDNTGRVGIGTVNPGTRLNVVGGNWDVTNTEGDLRIGNTTYRMKLGVATGGAGAGDVRMRAAGGTNRLMLGGGTADVLTVVGTGRVGINTITPQYALSVNGTIQAKEVRVETGWADYVFNNDYQLKSIDELEQYISINKHLPGVAPAAEVEKEGLKVGEMNKAMMEKIEELTLYIIQLSKENKQLKSEIDALKQ